jgi:hypothetical protein
LKYKKKGNRLLKKLRRINFMNVTRLKILSAVLLSTAVLSSAAHAAKEGMGGLNLGLVGGGMCTSFRNGDDQSKLLGDAWSTLYGGNLGLNVGWNFAMGRFILGIDASYVYNFIDGKVLSRRATQLIAANAGAANFDQTKDLNMEQTHTFQAGVLLGADCKAFMPFLRLGYSYNMLEAKGSDITDVTREKTQDDLGTHCFQWGLGVDMKFGYVVTGLEFVQDLSWGEAPEPKVIGLPAKDKDSSYSASTIRLRVLWHM